MIAFDDCDGASWLEEPIENHERLDRPREVLQDEADEDVIEGLGAERQSEDVRLAVLDVGEPGCVGPAPGFGDRVRGDVDRREASVGAPLRQGDRLGADAAPGLEHRLPPG